MVRVLIPLDGTSEAEAVFDLLKDDLNSNPEIILLQIVEPVRTVLIDGQVILGQSEEETEQARAITYLRGLAKKYGPLSDWRCKATIYEGCAGLRQNTSVHRKQFILDKLFSFYSARL